MDAKSILPVLALIGMAIIFLVIKSWDKEIENNKDKGHDAKLEENGCSNFGCLIGAILVAIFLISQLFIDY